MNRSIFFVLLFFFMSSASSADQINSVMSHNGPKQESNKELATFAGGCFWCLESTFDATDGVYENYVGYSGGDQKNPSYHDVAYSRTNHFEAIQVSYNPEKVPYKQLLHNFFLEHDPYDDGGQFCDRGDHYRPAVFYHNEDQLQIIKSYIENLEKQHEKKVLTKVMKYKNFYKAENYHQSYYLKNPERYKQYREACGRDQKLNKIWGKERKPKKK